MKMIQRSLASRVFLLQFLQIMAEFGKKIPWLYQLRNLQWSSNAQYFRDRLLLHFQCSDPSDIVPYQFVSDDPSREYNGGIVYFRKTPEIFIDPVNIEILNDLQARDYHYASCLQVRDDHRIPRHGQEIMKRVINLMRIEHRSFWGVFSDSRLLNWYLRLGARLLNPAPNKDNLYLVAWD